MIPVPDRFERQVAATPDRDAVVAGRIRLSYLGLDVRANRLAHRLLRCGVGPGELVAVLVDRGVDLVVTLLAVLKAGAGYVPLDVLDPPARVEHVLADCRAKVLVTSAGTGIAGAGHTIILGDHEYETALAACPVTAPTDAERVRPLTGDDTAYVIYTSGSTGRPKGVVIQHRAFAAYLDHAVAHYPPLAGTTLLHSSVSFDMAVTSLYGPLVTGGRVVLTDLRAAASGAAALPADLRPTFLKITPSHLPVLRELPAVYSPTEQLVIGGEALLGPALAPWRAEHPGVAVVNEYGPTEATVGCCVYTLEPGEPTSDGAVPIGRPTDGTRLYVLDPDLRPVRDGELLIAGAQLSTGYLNRPDLTDVRFLDDPFGEPGEKMYRTGDRVRLGDGGNLEYLGRFDDQVKVNGYRVELGEVEAAVVGSGLVTHAAVVARAGRLVAYVVGVVDADRLRESIAEQLPQYMIPSVVVLDGLPLTSNGKLDRAALPEPVESAGPAFVAARDDREAVLCRIVSEVTGATAVSIDDDFIAVGGSSIAAARLVGRARKEGVEISLMDVLRKRTVRAMLAG